MAGHGVLQAEISYDTYTWENGDIDRVFLLVAPIYGPSENLELSTEIPYVWRLVSGGPTTHGLGDINLVAKYVLAWERYETKDALLTMKGYVKLRSGSYEQELGRGDTEYVIGPVLSKIVNDRLVVHGQLAYAWVDDKLDPNLHNYAFGSVAMDYALTEPFHIVAEYYRSRNPDVGLPDQQMSLYGVTYSVSKDVIIDASYKKGIGPASPVHGIGCGIALQF